MLGKKTSSNQEGGMVGGLNHGGYGDEPGIIPPECEESPRTAAARAHHEYERKHSRRVMPSFIPKEDKTDKDD